MGAVVPEEPMVLLGGAVSAGGLLLEIEGAKPGRSRRRASGRDQLSALLEVPWV